MSLLLFAGMGIPYEFSCVSHHEAKQFSQLYYVTESCEFPGSHGGDSASLSSEM
jgi:hypothetical protein